MCDVTKIYLGRIVRLFYIDLGSCRKLPKRRTPPVARYFVLCSAKRIGSIRSTAKNVLTIAGRKSTPCATKPSSRAESFRK
jgi:hypothetical protein